MYVLEHLCLSLYTDNFSFSFLKFRFHTTALAILGFHSRLKELIRISSILSWFFVTIHPCSTFSSWQMMGRNHLLWHVAQLRDCYFKFRCVSLLKNRLYNVHWKCTIYLLSCICSFANWFMYLLQKFISKHGSGWTFFHGHPNTFACMPPKDLFIYIHCMK